MSCVFEKSRWVVSGMLPTWLALRCFLRVRKRAISPAKYCAWTVVSRLLFSDWPCIECKSWFRIKSIEETEDHEPAVHFPGKRRIDGHRLCSVRHRTNS